ncbi:fumarylacetoacetate hydrolase family protein [Motilimonas cestriensis]|uniref:Fumarylacetoacetate hydrolase family protein n=1 Tax=Motilimonas cestriensis TaxID=2742685 RepID=A0ABS8W9X4_9GAMM|nr:fumarylacetoacetate hydrolase family protein [Motilimonas cestriensis]MCE2595814.1 fumarylacetoacetate hydrolase family protein [Motilimonas cestriensis]
MKVPSKLLQAASVLLFFCTHTFTQANTLAPLDKGLTLAQIQQDENKRATLLVLHDTEKSVKAINLSDIFNSYPNDPMQLVRQQGYEKLLAQANYPAITLYQHSQLLAAGGSHTAHIAAGANYLAHGEEADIDEVFLFPKFAIPQPSESQIVLQPKVLLDYEVELCLRWDRDITSMLDFEQANTGVFLCGDFTDRAELLRKIDVDNVTSGHGFSDAKSGGHLMPTGPYLVVTQDWQHLLSEINLSTYVNGNKRQFSSVSKMLMPPNELVERILEQGEQANWRYQSRVVPLTPLGGIQQGQNLLTGTPEGVVYNTPNFSYKLTRSMMWLASLSFLDSGPVDYILEQYIADSLADQRFLQPGDHVHLSANYLGTLEVVIVAP